MTVEDNLMATLDSLSRLQASLDSITRTALKFKADRNALLAACKLLVSRIEDGTLVVISSLDGSPDWTMRMTGFVNELHQVQIAIANAEAPTEEGYAWKRRK